MTATDTCGRSGKIGKHEHARKTQEQKEEDKDKERKRLIEREGEIDR